MPEPYVQIPIPPQIAERAADYAADPETTRAGVVRMTAPICLSLRPDEEEK